MKIIGAVFQKKQKKKTTAYPDGKSCLKTILKVRKCHIVLSMIYCLRVMRSHIKHLHTVHINSLEKKTNK